MDMRELIMERLARKNRIAALIVATFFLLDLAGCTAEKWAFPDGVHRQSLNDIADSSMKAWHNAWIGQPRDALDIHPFFSNQQMKDKTTDSGVEVRTYLSGTSASTCEQSPSIYNKFGDATIVTGGHTSCANTFSGCQRMFYIKDKKIAEVVATGECRTDPDVYPRNDLAGLAGNSTEGGGK